MAKINRDRSAAAGWRQRLLAPLGAGIEVLGIVVLQLSCAGVSRPVVAPTLTEQDETLARRLLAVVEYTGEPLTSEMQARLVRLARDTSCPCSQPSGGADSVLASCATRGSCVRAPFAVRAMVSGLLLGLDDGQVSALLLERFGPRAREEIVLDDVPCRGPDKGLTLVVFSDFQCPACAAGRRLTELLLEQQSELRVCYKHFPLPQHERARPAAFASVAAQRQERFWEYHDLLFDHQDALEDDDLIGYARQLQLDMQRFESDRDAEVTQERVSADELEGNNLGVRGTPTYFLNGREVVGAYSVEEFLDWIEEEKALRDAR